MEALETKINMNHEEKTIRAYMHENDILQIKQSSNAYALGTWFLIFYKKDTTTVNTFLNDSIPQMYESRVIADHHKYPGLPYPMKQNAKQQQLGPTQRYLKSMSRPQTLKMKKEIT
eukprot:12745673-Ditylum_brightwellii.AAC.1